MRTASSKLISLYESNADVDDNTKNICSGVNDLWASMKSVHSMLILHNLIGQYHAALNDPEISSDEQLNSDITAKLEKFNALLHDIDNGSSVSNNTYHILLELQESLY
jgi:hypothetical protein